MATKLKVGDKQVEVKATTKSGQVRELHQQGVPVKEIAKAIGIRYQFAYNVVQRYEHRQAHLELMNQKAKNKAASDGTK